MSRFKYKAYTNLILELGRIDFAIEFNELSLRYFLRNLERSGNQNEFLKAQCESLGIYFGLNDVDDLRQRMTLSYIAFVYHAVESFFLEFKDEYNDMHNYKSTDPDRFFYKQGETKLNQLRSRFRHKFNIYDQIGDHLLDVFEYYHELRDKFSHPYSNNDNQLNKKHKIAAKHREILNATYNILNAPNESNQLDFEDFYLFTKVAKEICSQISAICLPEVEAFTNFLNINHFRKFKDNRERVKKAVSLELLKRYGYHITESAIFTEDITVVLLAGS